MRIDHFIPRMLGERTELGNLDGVWNLVLACRECNRGASGKGIGVPDEDLVDRLYMRNEYLISSHHPLRETLIIQTGDTGAARRQTLARTWNEARRLAIHVWSPGTAD